MMVVAVKDTLKVAVEVTLAGLVQYHMVVAVEDNLTFEAK
jgi:hypothetical protein